MQSQETLRHIGITGVILAGGRSTRMQGRDKGLIPWQGRPLVAHVLAAIEPQTEERLIVANRNIEEYRAFGVPVVGDLVPGHGGPLVGMLSGLSQVHTSWALVVPCDAPRLPANLAQKLLHEAVRSGAAWAASGADDHYTCCLLSSTLRGDLHAILANGTAAVREGLTALGARRVDFGATPGCIWNVNTPEALQALQATEAA